MTILNNMNNNVANKVIVDFLYRIDMKAKTTNSMNGKRGATTAAKLHYKT